MPLYSYECNDCQKTQEELFSIVNRPDFISCKDCQGPAHFKISPSQFIVNGASALNNYSGESNFKWIGEGSKPTKKS